MIANIERVSNLFLTKTTYAALLAILTVIVGWPYPFLPRHLTIVSALTIGIPAFFLAFAPSTQRYVPGSSGGCCASRSRPAIIIAISVGDRVRDRPRRDGSAPGRRARSRRSSSWCSGSTCWSMLARPFTRYRPVLLLAMIGLFLGALAIPFVRDFYALSLPSLDVVASGLAHRRGWLRRARARHPRRCERWSAGRAGWSARYSQPFFLNCTQSTAVAIAIVASAMK